MLPRAARTAPVRSFWILASEIDNNKTISIVSEWRQKFVEYITMYAEEIGSKPQKAPQIWNF